MVAIANLGNVLTDLGENGRPYLEQVHRHVDVEEIGPESTPGQAIARLARAVESFERGEPLFRGERLEDLPAGLEQWLRKTSQLAS